MAVDAVVMGLGRFGGGLAAAESLLAEGRQVLVTDLAEEAALQASVTKLLETFGAQVSFRLGGHEQEDETHRAHVAQVAEDAEAEGEAEQQRRDVHQLDQGREEQHQQRVHSWSTGGDPAFPQKDSAESSSGISYEMF